MFKYYKKQFIFLLKSELIGMRNPETESGREIKEALSDSKIQKEELTKLMIKINSEGKIETKKEVSNLLIDSLNNGIKIDNKDIKYSLDLLNFIKGSSKYNLNSNAIDTIKKNKDKNLNITGSNGIITVTPMSDPNIEIDDDDEQEAIKTITTNTPETQTEKKAFTEANKWYIDKKYSYTTLAKEELSKRFGIENIDSGLTVEQFNKIVEFQKINGFKEDGKIGNKTLTKILLEKYPVAKEGVKIIRNEEVENTLQDTENQLNELLKKDKLNINDVNAFIQGSNNELILKTNMLKGESLKPKSSLVITLFEFIKKADIDIDNFSKSQYFYKIIGILQTKQFKNYLNEELEVKNYFVNDTYWKTLLPNDIKQEKLIQQTEQIENQPEEISKEQTIENSEVILEQTTEIPDLTEEQEKFYDSVETQLSHTKLRTDNLFPKIRTEGIKNLSLIERKWIDDFDLDEGIGFNSIEIDPKTNNILLSFDDNFLNEGHNKGISISGCIENNKFDKLKFLEKIKGKAKESIIKYQAENPEEKLEEKDLPTVKEISDEEKERLKESIKRELSYTKISDKTSYFDKKKKEIRNFNIGQIVGLEDIEINLDENKISFSLDDDLINGKPNEDLVINMNLVDKNGNFDKMEFFVELAKLISY